MRIVFVTLFFPPARNAGTENYTLGLVQALQSRGHEVCVVCAEDWEAGAAYWNGVTEERYQGVVVHRVHLNWAKAQNPNRVLYRSDRVDRWFAQFLAKVKPDLVHVTSMMTLGVGPLYVTRQAGIPLVLTLMDFWFLCPRTVLLTGNGDLCDGKTTAWACQQCLLTGSRVFVRLRQVLRPEAEERVWRVAGRSPMLARVRGARGMALDMNERKSMLAEALTLPDLVLSHSAFVRDLFARAGVDRPIVYLPNGHDLTWRDGCDEKTRSHQLRIGYIGQINALKGVHVLVEAFRRAALGSAARLDIWGNLVHAPEFVQVLHTLIDGDDAIKLRGRFDRADLGRVLADIDVLVVPSLWYENAPLVIHEAFAVGTPVIATDLGGMREAVRHGVDGLLFARGDVEQLAGQLRRLVDEPALLVLLRSGIRPVPTMSDELVQLEVLYADVTRRARPRLQGVTDVA